MKKYLAALALVLVAVAVAFALAACGSATPAQKSFEADTAYMTELENCTKNSNTLAESKACEARADIRWHIDAGVSK